MARHDEIPVSNNFQWKQFRADSNVDNYDVQLYVTDPKDDPLASKMNIAGKIYRGVVETYDGNYIHQDYERQGIKQSEAKVDGYHHYGATKQMYSRDQICSYGLRMTHSRFNSSSFITFKEKQRVMSGFQLDMTFQILWPSQECRNYQCRN